MVGGGVEGELGRGFGDEVGKLKLLDGAVAAEGQPSVGPASAGAEPGPAAYGLGGRLPTVTDADVVLGRLPVDAPLGGRIRLDADAARAAVGALARELGLGLEECAEGILTVAVQEMVRALRLVSVERGEDARDATLIAFGGAGPLHATAIADELGIRRILVPVSGGVFSALGLAAAVAVFSVANTLLWQPPPHVADPDSLVRKEGRDAFAARVAAASPAIEYLFSRLGEGLDVTHLDGQAQLATLVLPLIERVPDSRDLCRSQRAASRRRGA